nr:hydroxyproline O-galactosyltransferase GALT4 [Aegilops tauschii subsp. strangulata]
MDSGMSAQWKASPLPTEPVELFIGILSAANNFAEWMAGRKSWMIATRKSSNSVGRFFVALTIAIAEYGFPAALQEWEEEVYPPYANGPGYVISSDIAEYIVSEFDNQKLRLFKMEDVSMGMWVQKFDKTRQPVEYSHDVKFFQAGCFDGYYTAHY